jgi:diacylglycerol kinase
MTQPPGPRAFLARRARSFRYAFAGLGYVLRTQPNAWIHALATGAVFAVALWLEIGRSGWSLLALAMGLVWVAEIANTALEALTDLAAPGPDPLARTAKDCAAAAVLVAAGVAVIVGLLVLGPPLWDRIGR